MDQQATRKRQRKSKSAAESTEAQATKRKRGRPKTQCEDCRQSLRHPKCTCLKKRTQPSTSPSPSDPSTKDDVADSEAETLSQVQSIEHEQQQQQLHKQYEQHERQHQETREKKIFCSCECSTTLCPCWDCISRYCDCLINWDLMGPLKAPDSVQVQVKVDE